MFSAVRRYFEENPKVVKYIIVYVLVLTLLITVGCIVSKADSTYSTISYFNISSAYSATRPTVGVSTNGSYWGQKQNGNDMVLYADPVILDFSYGVWTVSGSASNIATLMESRTPQGVANTLMYSDTSITFLGEDVGIFELHGASLGSLYFCKMMSGSPSGLQVDEQGLTYQQGYAQGVAEWQSKYNTLKESYDDLASDKGLDNAIRNAYSQGMGDSNVVVNSLSSVINGIGGVFADFFQMRVLGIPVMSILLIPVVIGISVFLIKLFL